MSRTGQAISAARARVAWPPAANTNCRTSATMASTSAARAARVAVCLVMANSVNGPTNDIEKVIHPIGTPSNRQGCSRESEQARDEGLVGARGGGVGGDGQGQAELEAESR